MGRRVSLNGRQVPVNAIIRHNIRLKIVPLPGFAADFFSFGGGRHAQTREDRLEGRAGQIVDQNPTSHGREDNVYVADPCVGNDGQADGEQFADLGGGAGDLRITRPNEGNPGVSGGEQGGKLRAVGGTYP